MNGFELKKTDRMDAVALCLCLLAFVSWGLLLSYKFFHFEYVDWDLAFFAQAMWNLAHGSADVSLFGINFFSNHANLIAYVILPLYKLFPHPLTLIFLKIISYATAAFILYLFAKEKLGGPTAIFILVLYLIYAPNLFGLIYEFDFESLSVGILMLLFFFYRHDRWPAFMFSAVLLMLIKENMPFIITAFSIHALFVKKDKFRWTIIPGVGAMVYFYLIVYVFMPHISGRPIGQAHPYYIEQNYKEFGGSITGIFYSCIFHPVKVLQHIMSPSVREFLVAIFNPFLYLPLLSPGVLWLIAPILAQHVLSGSNTEHFIAYSYVLTMAPFIFAALIETMSFLGKEHRRAGYLCLSLLLILNFINLLVNFHVIQKRFEGRYAGTQIFHDPPGEPQVHERWALVHMVPPQASVAASMSFLAPLSQRKELLAFYKVYDARFQDVPYPYHLPSSVQYVLIDIHDPWMIDAGDYPLARARVQQFLMSGDWEILKRYGRFILYKRKLI